MRKKIQTRLSRGFSSPKSLRSLKSPRRFLPGAISIFGLIGLMLVVALAPVVSEWKPDNVFAVECEFLYKNTDTITAAGYTFTLVNTPAYEDESSYVGLECNSTTYYHVLYKSKVYALAQDPYGNVVRLCAPFDGYYPYDAHGYIDDSSCVDFDPNAASLELSLSSDTLNLSSTNADGSGFVSASVTSSVTSTAAGGYNLYMSASGKDQSENYTASLVNANDKQYTIGTLPANGNIDLSFSTSDGNRAYANTSSFTANKWAYSVQDLTGRTDTEISSLSGTSTFKAIPLDETVINTASADSATSSTAINTLNGETTGGVASTRPSNIFTKKSASGAAGDGASADEIEVTIAARTDNATPAGNYTNTLVFTVIGIDYSGVIVYDPNGEVGDGTSAGADGTTTVGGDMSMVTHTNVASGDSVNLYAPNYWRKGYGFAGWSEDKDAASKLAAGQSVTVYGPNETITAPSTVASKGMRLYAVWVASAGDMQKWAGCASMSTGAVTALTDTRDGNVYAVAKLGDNKCWMSENLRLSSGAVNASNTNNPVSNFAWTASNNSWCTSQDSACYNQVLLNTNNLNSSLDASPTTDNNSSSWYGYGTYYDWYAATAGNGTYEVSTGNVSGDICPLGWHLPTSTSTGEFQAMYTAIGATPTNIRKYPNNFVLSGYWNGSSAYTRGSYGYYWSSTAYNTDGAYRLYMSSSYVNPSSNSGKNFGFSARCIADSTYTISYNANGGSGTMNNTHANVKTGDTVNLIAPNFSRTGYGFLGWSFDANAGTSGNTSTIYGPNESISAPSSYGQTTMTLYAIWKASAGNMQSWTGCSSMSIGDVTALKDTRDNNVYAVAKLGDNKCWMSENLRLSSGTISATTTHAPASGFALGSASTSWCTDANSTCYDKSVWNNNNSTAGYYSYGNYYNWFSATAGNGKYATSSGNVSGDICPLGWHLPTSTSSGEFQAMYTAIGATPANIRKYPNNFVLSSFWRGSSAGSRESNGDYWSSTAYNNNDAYYLSFSSSYVNLSDYYRKHLGYSVRCVAG